MQPTGSADIRTAVDFARDNRGLLLAVKCGGHSHSGQSTCDRGMLIDLSLFRDVRVDPVARRAWVTGGSLLGQVDHESMVDYVAVQRSSDTDDPRAQGMYLKSGFVSSIPEDLVSAIVDRFQADPRRSTAVFSQLGGGAIARVPADATAFAQRDILANLLCSVSWKFGDDPADHIQWIKQYWPAIIRSQVAAAAHRYEMCRNRVRQDFVHSRDSLDNTNRCTGMNHLVRPWLADAHRADRVRRLDPWRG